jgi:hypothetical protein
MSPENKAFFLEGLELEVGDIAGPPLALLSLHVPGLRSLLYFRLFYVICHISLPF